MSHEHVYEKLKIFKENNNIPNIIFHGSSGSGKKTILFDFLHTIYENKQCIRTNVMVVNCSHGKGIRFIRDDLKMFAKTNMNQNIQFKSIILLNADSLTNDAQSALRRCIEQFSNNTRFFIVIEHKERLLNPILSRFCCIYVPYMINENGEIYNYYQKDINLSIMKWFDENIDSCLKNTDIDNKQMLALSTKIYENGYCCLDVIDYITMKKYENYNHIVLCFEKVKSQFKNEKLLLLFVLNNIVNNPYLDFELLD